MPNTTSDASADAMSIPEFCRRHSISVDFYFKLQRHGRGPDVIRIGGRTLISKEAAARWRKRREREPITRVAATQPEAEA
jgi:hypothetical protein